MAVLGGFSLEKALLLFGLIWFHLLQPGEGKLKWWRARYWDGKCWYVWADGGFWEPLTDSEYLSLRKAMRKDATIGDYIHDESRIGEKTGCWDVSDWRPIWDKYLEVWRIPVNMMRLNSFGMQTHSSVVMISLEKAHGLPHPTTSLEKAHGLPHPTTSLDKAHGPHPTTSLEKAHIGPGGGNVISLEKARRRGRRNGMRSSGGIGRTTSHLPGGICSGQGRVT